MPPRNKGGPKEAYNIIRAVEVIKNVQKETTLGTDKDVESDRVPRGNWHFPQCAGDNISNQGFTNDLKSMNDNSGPTLLVKTSKCRETILILSQQLAKTILDEAYKGFVNGHSGK